MCLPACLPARLLVCMHQVNKLQVGLPQLDPATVVAAQQELLIVAVHQAAHRHCVMRLGRGGGQGGGRVMSGPVRLGVLWCGLVPLVRGRQVGWTSCTCLHEAEAGGGA